MPQRKRHWIALVACPLAPNELKLSSLLAFFGRQPIGSVRLGLPGEDARREFRNRSASNLPPNICCLQIPVDTAADSHRSVIRFPSIAVLFWTRIEGVGVLSTPSIVPNDRLDKDFYFVLEDFRSGAAFRETDEGITYHSLIDDLLDGQYGRVLRIVSFNPLEGWSRDASEDIAEALELHIGAEDREVPAGLRDFIEGQLGRKIGQQLVLL